MSNTTGRPRNGAELDGLAFSAAALSRELLRRDWGPADLIAACARHGYATSKTSVYEWLAGSRQPNQDARRAIAKATGKPQKHYLRPSRR